MFKCLFCGHEAGSDKVAAMKYLIRSIDPDIGLYVPSGGFRQILVGRFRRRLECWDFDVSPALFNWASVACLFKDWESLRDESTKRWSKRTVAGMTPDTGKARTSDCVGDKPKACRIAGGTKHQQKVCHHADNTAPVNRRAKRPQQEAKPIADVA